MRKIIRKWLGVEQLEGDLKLLESRLSMFEDSVTKKLNSFGQYRTKSESELIEMRATIDCMIEACEAFLKDANNKERNQQQAKPLLRRLRNNRTRIINTLEAA